MNSQAHHKALLYNIISLIFNMKMLLEYTDVSVSSFHFLNII